MNKRKQRIGKQDFYAIFTHVEGQALTLGYYEITRTRDSKPNDIELNEVHVKFKTRRQRDRVCAAALLNFRNFDPIKEVGHHLTDTLLKIAAVVDFHGFYPEFLVSMSFTETTGKHMDKLMSSWIGNVLCGDNDLREVA